MASTREIRGRIRSAKNVAKITRAMEMVSASKMRRAQRNVQSTRPYVDHLVAIMSELMERMVGSARRGTLLEARDTVRNVALVLVSPDRGLCGSLVSNQLRHAGRFILDQRQQGRNVEVHAIGRKGRDFMNRYYQNVVSEATHLGDRPELAAMLGVAINVIRGFQEARYDEVYVIYSQFVNTLNQRSVSRKLIPVEPPPASEHHLSVDYTYEPGEEEVLRDLLPRYVEVLLYQAVLENIASEHSARMVAMQNATSNAKDLVRELTLSYNKARQTNITNEVSEIAAGANALVAMQE
ncbi:MAG: F0F1 ATP synthase subunit gamma [Chloroflexaceae bacterium]|nr:F0F1 ATP synthase subunit gamma [Chloroflexaceae bacterium]